MSILLKNTIELIGNAFIDAEEHVRRDIELSFSGATEEQITTIFQLRLGEEINKISEEKNFESAFQKDIEQAIRWELSGCLPSYGIKSNIKSISDGLVAKISWHQRHIEAKTGGDFGIVIIQPQIGCYSDKIEIERCGEQRGLLVQAKLKRFKDTNWGKLTSMQEKLLPKRMKYLSILRYKYLDKNNKNLDKFSWSLFNDNNIDNIKSWLKNDRFPTNKCTNDIIVELGLGEIGTSDKDIINKIIEPQETPTMIIRIDWKDKGPGFNVNALNKEIEHLLNKNKKLNYVHL